MRVSSNGRASAFQADDGGSNPLTRSNATQEHKVARGLGKAEALGSIPRSSSMGHNHRR